MPNLIMERFLGRLASRGLDGFVHFQTNKAKENVVLHYLTGVQGLEDSGLVVSLASEPTLLVKDFEGQRARRTGRVKDVRAATTIPLESAISAIEEITKEKKLTGKKVAIDDSELNVEVYLRLQKLGMELVPFSEQIRALRMVKTKEEVDNIRTASKLAAQSLLDLRERLDEGLTEEELGAVASLGMEKRGGEKSFVHVQYGVNASVPHHVSGKSKVSPPGLLVVDLGAKVMGYNSDITRTIQVGKPATEHEALVKVVRKALEAATATVMPGAEVGSVAQAARDEIRKAGLPQPLHRIGHGIGLNVHEAPIVEKGFPGKLEEGMVIAVEPGVYLEGETGCRLETNILVTSKGAEPLDPPYFPL